MAYKSLKPWINIPFTLHAFDKRNSSGTKQFKQDIEMLCYPVGKVTLVRDTTGAEVVSNTQLYIDNVYSTEEGSFDTAITVLDEITLEGMRHSIINATCYYRNGHKDIWVVFI